MLVKATPKSAKEERHTDKKNDSIYDICTDFHVEYFNNLLQ